ncbi:MAG: TetR/AcrR family transcriptional regulator C-terminal domain-containing protein [Pseudomonadota bacterium]
MVKRKKLTPEGIVREAIQLLDKQGYKNFSMRRLANYCGVDPMALYYHIPNRAALIGLVVEEVVGKCELPAAGLAWQEAVRQVCRGFRKVAHEHPGVIQVYDEFEDWIPGEHRLIEALHVAFESGGFDKQGIVRGSRLVLAYTENFCAWELDEWLDPYTPEMRHELLDSLEQGDYPVTMTLIDETTDVDCDTEFEFGLDVLIQGLEVRLT